MCPNPEVVLELAADADSTRNSRLLIQLEGGTAFPGLPLPRSPEAALALLAQQVIGQH